MTRLSGGLIDRNRSLNFSFDGKSYTGHAGDTLASALLANDVRLMGRGFKYHRPRGVFTAGSEEPNALVELRHATGKSRTPAPPRPSCSRGWTPAARTMSARWASTCWR